MVHTRKILDEINVLNNGVPDESTREKDTQTSLFQFSFANLTASGTRAIAFWN